MDWLMLGGLAIIWAGYIFPPRARARSRSSVEEFERNMGLLEQTEKATGRWIVAPRKGEAFMGRHERARSRARERRRKVFMFLIEALLLTALIGLFPPLHGMWILTGVVFLMLVGYAWMLVGVKRREAGRPRPRHAASTAAVDVPLGPAAPDPDHELPWLREGDIVHVKVHTADELAAAGVGA